MRLLAPCQAGAPCPPDVLVRRRPSGAVRRGVPPRAVKARGRVAGRLARDFGSSCRPPESGPGASRAIRCNDLGRMSSHGKAARLHQSSFVNPQCASAATRTTARTSHDPTRCRLAPATSSWSRTASAMLPARAGGRTSSGYRTTTDTPCPRARRRAALRPRGHPRRAHAPARAPAGADAGGAGGAGRPCPRARAGGRRPVADRGPRAPGPPAAPDSRTEAPRAAPRSA